MGAVIDVHITRLVWRLESGVWSSVTRVRGSGLVDTSGSYSPYVLRDSFPNAALLLYTLVRLFHPSQADVVCIVRGGPDQPSFAVENAHRIAVL